MRSCYLIQSKVVVVYIYPFGAKWDNYAKRFAKRYTDFRPTVDHRLLIIANGGQPTPAMRKVFEQVPCDWKSFTNAAWDIGAFQHVSKTVPADLMVFLGASTYMRRAGWLERMVQSYDKHGLAIYGSMGHRGALQHRVYPHVRTSAWWINPKLFNLYPIQIKHTSQRYEFEHGPTCICEWVRSQGLERWVVAFDGDYTWPDWDKIKNGYHRGNQTNCLTGDRLTEPPFYPIP